MRSHLVYLILMIIVAPAGASNGIAKLGAQDRAVFCGRDGHETSAPYASAVNREVTWRIAAGARTPKEALVQMRQEYCPATGSTK